MSEDWISDAPTSISSILSATKHCLETQAEYDADLATHTRSSWRLEDRRNEAQEELGRRLDAYIDERIAKRLAERT